MAIDTTTIGLHHGVADSDDPVAPEPTPGPGAGPTPRGDPALATEASVPYMPALDGMRALAVAAVLAYHGGVGWTPGGFLGVEIFFVISGFLITALLVAERQRIGGTAYLSFWARRARRLLPALFAVLVVVSAVWLVRLPSEAATIRGDVVGALTYVTNWYQIVVHHSYFETIGRPSPLRHLWSLAVEEQFYLFWPIALGGLHLLTRGRRRHLLVVVAALAVASAAWGIHLYRPGADPSRVYYGTDTRAAGLLAGAALAIALGPWLMRAEVGRRARAVIGIVGLAAVAAVIAIVVSVSEFDPVLYQGGSLVVDLLVVVAIAAAVHPCASACSRLLAARPLVWVGKRSYGIYLWHWPIFVLTRPNLDVTMSPGALLALRFALTMVLAEISYKVIETPMRKGALRRLWAFRTLPDGPLPRRARRQLVGGAVASVIIVATLGVAMALTRPATTTSGIDLAGTTTDQLGTVVDVTLAAPHATPAPVATTTSVVASGPPRPGLAGPPALVPIPGNSMIAMGDSVLLGARAAVRDQFPNILINAEVSRQFNALVDLVPALARVGALRSEVIIHLGTNGPPSAADVTRVLDSLGGATRIALVNTHEPRPWQSVTNDRLAAAVVGRPNVVLVDWYRASSGHPDYFAPDGVHLSPAGAQAYAVAISAAFR